MKGLTLAVLVVLGVFGLQLAGAAILAGPAWAAQAGFTWLVRCCGQEVAVPVVTVACIGGFGGAIYGLVVAQDWWRDRRFHRR